MYAAAQIGFTTVAQNEGVKTRYPPAESVNKWPACEEADRNALERAENEGLAEQESQLTRPSVRTGV
jgi:hypothetical protein